MFSAHGDAPTTEVMLPQLSPRKTTLYVLPFAAALALFELPFPLSYILWFPGMMIHELGHALGAFAVGGIGVAFFFASFSIPPSTNTLFFALLIDLVVGGLSYYRGNRALTGLIVLFALIQVTLFLTLSIPQGMQIVVLAGMGGEIVGPMLLMLFFLTRTVIPPSWKGWLIVVPLSLYHLAHQTVSWIRATADTSKIPYPRDHQGGTGLFQDPFAIADGVPAGDLEKLLRVHGWTEAEITTFYLGLALLAWGMIASMLITARACGTQPAEDPHCAE